jgi:hypothetical protein
MSNALQAFNHIVAQMNCTHGNNQMILACLRNCSVDDLMTAYGSRQIQPIIENYYFFPFYPPLAIQNGKYNQSRIFSNKILSLFIISFSMFII